MRNVFFVKAFLLLISVLLASCDQSPSGQRQAGLNPLLPDFSSFIDVKQKKQAFFDFMKPLIDQANQAVMAERQQVLAWQQQDALNDDDRQALQQLAKKYRVDAATPEQQLQQLEQRIHTIPPSLVMAQAANESAWGTSRFALEGNNLFGQWCFSKGCGIVPSSRNSGANHEVARFDSPYESVASYIRNLNSHPSYQQLRTLRAQELSDQAYSTGSNLAGGLLKYSERGEEYVKEIRAMIRHNKLAKFDLGQDPQPNQG